MNSHTTPPPNELDELAALTGYQPEPLDGRAAPTAKLDSLTGDADDEAGDSTALLDPEDLDDEASRHRLWSSPWSKLAFVGLIVGAGAAGIGLLLFSFQSKWNSGQPEVAAETQPAPTPTTLPTDPSNGEVGDLKTKEALSRQAEALSQTTDSVTPAPSTPGATPAPASATAPAEAITPTPVTPIQRSATPSYREPVTYSAPVAPPRAASGSASRAAPKADPHEQWQTAAQLGSYGQISYPPSPAVAPTATMAAATQPDPTPPGPPTDPQQTRYTADANAILSGTPSRVISVTAGTTTAATLVTPIVWAQDLDNSEQPQRFGVQLTQPLLAADGTEALPTGTQMVAQVDTISDSGLVELSVLAVVAPTSNGNQLVAVPPGAILIQGEGGNPLMAQNYNNDGRIQQLNTQIGIIGALGKVGELLNRPTNATTTTSPYLSTTSVSNGNTNLLGGLLEGGFGAMQDQMTQQDQQEIKDILNRPNVWFVPANQALQVFASSSFEVMP